MQVREYYQNNVEKNTDKEAVLKKKMKRISLLRITSFLLALASLIGFGWFNLWLPAVSLLVLFLIIFIVFIFRHSTVKNEFLRTKEFGQINQRCLLRCDDLWQKNLPDGEKYQDENHAYCDDLDIFGKSSLFQYINATTTFLGESFLVRLLKEPLKSKKDIEEQQQAVQELASKVEMRQNFETEGRLKNIVAKDPFELIIKIKQNLSWQPSKAFFIFTIISPLLLVICGILAAFHLINWIPATCLLVEQIIVLGLFNKKISALFQTVSNYSEDLEVYHNLAKIIEEENFTSVKLQALQEKLLNGGSQGIGQLSQISDKMKMRRNQMHVIINVLVFWDFYCLRAYLKWRQNYGNKVEVWLQAIAEFEVISSLASLAFEHQNWCFPQISEQKYFIEVQEMAHPLIPASKRVANNFSLKNEKSVALITGSNMSGKSTFMRTLGINLLLARLGAPVCAQTFTTSILQIYTSMRIKDNIEKNISSFYAELLRIKMIISAAENQEPMIYLLDEIFRGTNSLDRHYGAKAVLRHLASLETMGMITTHDLELTSLENEKSLAAVNYHFNEQYENDQIKFDYKLKDGISETRNARYLMRLVGIKEV